MARKMVKSFFKHPAPVPHRGAEGGSGRGGSKMNLTKKNSSGNGLKWQENWSNHFHGTLPPTHLSFMFLNQKTAKGIHEWYSKSKGQKQLDENTSVKKWEIFEITPLFFTAFQTFPVKMKSCEYDFQISFQNWLAI